MKVTVTKKFSFCYGHCLPGYLGKCQNIHGHNADIEITVSGTYFGVGEYSGMVVDFNILKSFLAPLIEKYDHRFLNDFLPIPTAENMAKHCFEYLEEKICPEKNGLVLERVKISETPDSWAEVTR